MLGEHLSQFSPQVPTYIPFFGQKRPPGGKKNGKKNFWAKYSKLKNRLEKKIFLSELQELEVRAKFGQTDQNGQIQLKFQALVASRRNPGHGFGHFKKRAKRMIWKLRVLHKLIMYDSNTWQMCREILFVWPYGGRLRAAVRCLAKVCFF